MTPFDDFEVEESLRPSAKRVTFDLAASLNAVMTLSARVPDDAYTAQTLGIRRLGNGIVISEDGLVLTIGYLITEADQVTLTSNDGRQTAAHVLGYDQVTGLGLLHALEPLDLPVLSIGDSRSLEAGDPVILAGGGGQAHAVQGRLLVRAPFAGYWEYNLEEALYTGPGHPHWSGAALIGPSGDLVGVGSLQMTQELATGEESLINMCVPAELLRPILDDLASGRAPYPPRPWLGVFSQDARGKVVVADFAADGPAARAEVRRGDAILAVGGHSVSSLAEFYTRLWSLGPAGVIAPLRLQRERDVFDIEVRTVDRASKLKKRRFN